MLRVVKRVETLSPLALYDARSEALELKLHLKKFVVAAWHLIDPAPFVDGYHIDAICEHLEAVSRGQIKRLLINMPPRHAKSSIVSVLWRVWSWITDPTEQWLAASYVQDLAERDNRRCRQVFEHYWFQEHWPNLITFKHDQNLKGNFENTVGGYQICTAVGARGGTGKGGNRLLIDDPHPAHDGALERRAVSRENAITWFKETWQSRLNDREKGAMVIVGQRIHMQDLSGYILEQGGTVHLNLPAEFIPGRKCVTYLPIDEKTVTKKTIPSFTDPDVEYELTFKGEKVDSCTCPDRFYHPERACKHMQAYTTLREPFWEDWRTIEGEPLWAEKFPSEVLAQLQHDMTTLPYFCQFQQSPVPPGGHVFKKENERLFTIDREAGLYLLETPSGILPVEIKKCWHCTTSDVAAKAKEQNDFVVFSTWAITPDFDVLLIDVRRGHWSIPEQEKQAKKVYYAFNDDSYTCIWFEDVGYQSAIGQNLVADGIPCMPFTPHADKLIRAGTASIWMKLGKVYFLKNAIWLVVWQKEIYGFPKEAHDDQVDTLSMICLIVRKHGPAAWSPDSYTPPSKTYAEAIQAAEASTPAVSQQPQQQTVHHMVEIDDPPPPAKVPSMFDWDFVNEGEMIDLEVNL